MPHPVYVAIAAAGPGLKWLTYFINIGAIAGLASVVLVMLMGQPRVFFSMSKDGLLPPIFAKVHPKFQTPYVTTIVTGIVAAHRRRRSSRSALLGELVSIGTLLAFVIVCFGVIVLRRRSPDLARPFKTPMVPLVPILGIAICGYMMYALPARHVDPAHRVDGDRARDLLRLQPVALEGRESGGRLSAPAHYLWSGVRGLTRAPLRFHPRVMPTLLHDPLEIPPARRAALEAVSAALATGAHRRAEHAHQLGRRRLRLRGGARADARRSAA